MEIIKEILKEVEQGALEKKGKDIVLLNVGKLSDITDYYFILTAQNERQIKAIRDEIEHRLKKKFHLKMRLENMHFWTAGTARTYEHLHIRTAKQQ